MLRSLEIDIAVDLTGYTDGLRPQIFSLRPAPVQVNYLGYPGTSGAPYMDYIIADEFVIPPELMQYYSEHAVYLPGCYQANDDRRAIEPCRLTRRDAGLPGEGFVFCCFNNSYKINPVMFDLWMRLLHRIAGSVLWLVSARPEVAANLRREARERGVDPGRLVFAGRLPYEEHLQRLQLADIFLDTLPFNGGATVSDALWAGLPVLTCAGRAFAARMAGSLLKSAGIAELVMPGLTEYESMAARLAEQPQLVSDLRRRLRENRRAAPLFDTDLFRRRLESAYVEMWRRCERGEAPASFAVGEAALRDV
jgi:predicted O-linked N-acetylglucosamine transferase (SPINDLY family)